MAVTEEQFERYIDMMRKAVQDGSLGGARTKDDARSIVNERALKRSKAEEMRMEKARQKVMEESHKVFTTFNKTLDKFSDNLGIRSQIIQDALDHTIENLSSDEFEKIPEVLQKKLSQSRMFSGANIQNMEQSFAFFEDLADKKELIEGQHLREYLKEGMNSSAQTLELMERVAKRHGMTLDETARSIHQFRREVAEGVEIQQQLNHELRGGNWGEFRHRLANIADGFDKIKTQVKAIAEGLAQGAAPAMKFGTDYASSFTSFMNAMKPEEMAANIGAYRQSIQAAGMSIGEFRDLTEEGSSALTTHTGSLANSVKLQASAFDAAKLIGMDSADNMKMFMDQQIDTFKKLNTVFSVTSDEFIKMNKQISDSAEINAHMYRLNQKQRMQAHMDIQQTVVRLRTMGLMQEESMKVVEAMSAIAAKSPKERLKQAARLQAVGGALGFGAEAGEAASIMRRGFNQEGDRERFAMLQQGMQKQLGSFMGQGLPQEMMASQMLAATKLEDVLGPKSAFSSLNTKQFKATENIEQLNETRNQMLGSMLSWFQRIDSFFNGPLYKVFSNIVKILAGIAAGLGVGALAKNLMGGITSAVTGGGGMALLGKILKTALKFIVGGGIIATIVAATAGAAFAYNEANTPPEEKTWWESMTGLSEDEEQRKKQIAEIVKLREQKAHIARASIEGAIGHLVPELSKKSRIFQEPHHIGDRGKEIKTAEGSMYLRKYEGMSLPEQTRIDLAQNMKAIEAAQDKMRMERNIAEEKGNTEEAKRHDENIKLLQEKFDELKAALHGLNNPTERMVKAVQDQTEKQGEQHEETMNASKKSVKLMWTRVSAGAGG